MTEEQANLLQVGDWLYCPKANECFQIGNGDITDAVIEKKHLYIPKFRSFFDNSTIPLTDEILEKNGFTKDVGSDCTCYYFPKISEIEKIWMSKTRLLKYDITDQFIFEGTPFIGVRTVDEFQRLLRLMGFVYFANNFKV